MEFPEPVIHVAIEPKTKADQDKLGKALYVAVRRGPDVPGPLRRGDRPDRHLRHGRAAPRGPGRPHAARVQRRRHRRQAAGRLPRDDHRDRSSQGRVPAHQADRRLGPVRRRRHRSTLDRTRAAATSSSTRSAAARSRKEYIQPVDQGMQAALDTGVLAGYPTVDVKATLVDGQYHDVDSSEMAFKIAGTMAFKKAAERPSRCCSSRSWPSRSSPPTTTWVTSWATCPAGGAGSRAWSQRATPRSSGPQVPLGEMFGYSTDLRSRTQGRATYTMQFDSYQQMPNIDPGRDRRPRPRRVSHTTAVIRKHGSERFRPPWPRRSSSGTSRI